MPLFPSPTRARWLCRPHGRCCPQCARALTWRLPMRRGGAVARWRRSGAMPSARCPGLRSRARARPPWGAASGPIKKRPPPPSVLQRTRSTLQGPFLHAPFGASSLCKKDVLALARVFSGVTPLAAYVPRQATRNGTTPVQTCLRLETEAKWSLASCIFARKKGRQDQVFKRGQEGSSRVAPS